MSDSAEQKATDAYTMASCRRLVNECQALPKGETKESMGEFVEVHRKALSEMKQRAGKAVLVLEMEQLAKKYPPPEAP